MDREVEVLVAREEWGREDVVGEIRIVAVGLEGADGMDLMDDWERVMIVVHLVDLGVTEIEIVGNA